MANQVLHVAAGAVLQAPTPKRGECRPPGGRGSSFSHAPVYVIQRITKKMHRVVRLQCLLPPGGLGECLSSSTPCPYPVVRSFPSYTGSRDYGAPRSRGPRGRSRDERRFACSVWRIANGIHQAASEHGSNLKFTVLAQNSQFGPEV